MIPGCSRNWRRTSWTTVPAERPTARMASEENRNTIDPPISSPMNMVGLATLIWVLALLNSAAPLPGMFSLDPMVSIKDPKSETAAMTAEPMATPLVTALVVFPTASRLTMTRSASPVNSSDISAMPAALSHTGPKLSWDTTIPAVDNMPMPIEDTR